MLFRSLARFVGIGCERTSRSGCAEAATAGADVSQDHEGGRPSAPAFGLIGASSAAADRVQPVFFDDVVYFGPFGSLVEADLQPSGFFEHIYLVMKLRHLSSLFSYCRKIRKNN